MENLIKQLLSKRLNASRVEVVDESPNHAGHAQAQKSGGGHYAVVVVSEMFAGKSLIERHRLVYAALSPLKDKIHALSIKAVTKDGPRVQAPGKT